ncbi:MAG: FAD:protein FMN transferase, partial [Bacteroidota bacterium]
QEMQQVRRVTRVMGSRFEFTAVDEDARRAEKALNAGIKEVRRIEALISSWDPLSETSEVNRQAGIAPVKVSKELYDLIFRSLKVSDLTGGAFDISFASIDWIWKFDGSMEALPDSSTVEASVAKIGFEDVLLDADSQTVFLREVGMKIGFGAIGKGYAANRARKVMQEMGIRHGVVNAGGDLRAWGKQAHGGEWRVGISDPKDRKKVLAWLWVDDLAVVTSGDYEKFVELEGKRFTHIVDPKTGWPVQGLQSVTIVCADAEVADALATAVFVMGEKEGLALVEELKGIECVLVNAAGEMKSTKGLKLNYFDAETGEGMDYLLKVGEEK